MKCPICRDGELAWAWTLESPEFRVGKGRCQNFDCCTEYIVTRAADELLPAQVDDLAAAKPLTGAIQ